MVHCVSDTTCSYIESQPVEGGIVHDIITTQVNTRQLLLIIAMLEIQRKVAHTRVKTVTIEKSFG